MGELLAILEKYNHLLLNGTLETLYMVSVSLVIAVIFGIPLGVLTTITRKGHILTNNVLNKILDGIINIGRSIPFIILMVAIIPLTRALVRYFYRDYCGYCSPGGSSNTLCGQGCR